MTNSFRSRERERGRAFATPAARFVCIVVAALHATMPIAAQSPPSSQQATPPGWVFTPSIGVAEVFDNNVLLSTEGSDGPSDFLTTVSPRAALGFRGRYSTFQLDYSSAYQLYQELSQLNAFEQRLNASFRQLLTPRVSFVAKNSLSKSPTTDALDMPGVVFRRQGVTMDDFRGGIEARLTEHTTLGSDYTFQWLKFDDDDVQSPIDALERGGLAHGVATEVDHVLNSRLTIGGRHEMRHATVDNEPDFDVQSAMGTAEWRIDRRLTLSGGAGYAWLATNGPTASDSAPTFQVDLNRSGSRLGWNVGYRRSFLPSVGFGGTFQNQEFQAGAFGPITRRLDWGASTSVLDADPLNGAARGLRSIWARSSLRYLATRWMRIEGYYVAVFQDTGRTGGKINRSRVGFQIVTTTRTRIR
jgi:hypothetical protein